MSDPSPSERLTQRPGSPVPIGSLPNLRDLGGWPTADGRHVRHGLVFRSTALDRLTPHDATLLGELGIRTIFDLRTGAERDQGPDRVPTGAEHVIVDVLADANDAAPAQLLKVLDDPAAAERMLGDGRAAELFGRGYRAFVSLPSASRGYQRLFIGIARAEVRPALFHCTTGKDRTGWAAASLLLLLGVAESDAMREYLLTNDQLLPALQPVFDRFAAAGGDPSLLRPVLGVDAAYLEGSLAEMRSRHGTIERYFSDALGLDAAFQRDLRDTLLES